MANSLFQFSKNMEESNAHISPEDYAPPQKNKYNTDDKSIARTSNPMTESQYMRFE